MSRAENAAFAKSLIETFEKLLQKRSNLDLLKARNIHGKRCWKIIPASRLTTNPISAIFPTAICARSESPIFESGMSSES